MTARPPADRLRRMRLAAQRLVPATAARDAVEACRSVVGIQAQDVRAAGLALRSRVPGLERAAIADAPLVRTWTVRGTVHLIDGRDRAWLHALVGPRNRRSFDGLMEKRGALEAARAMLPHIVAVLDEGPRSRAALLAELGSRGHPELGQGAINVVTAWASAHGVVVGLADGRLRSADPPPRHEEDDALAILGRRYLAGYGPASAADLAHWSGLPITTARRALAAVEGTEAAGDLVAPAGTFDREPPRAPGALLLAAFDTALLGYRSREPIVAAADDGHVLPGGGILRPTVLARGRASGTWRLDGSGARRALAVAWFGRPAPSRALAAEARDVARFLGVQLR